MAPRQQTHKPGAFKQPHKRHKTGRHRTKGEIDRGLKGRRAFKKRTQHSQGSKYVKKIQRVDRLQQQKQLREKKRLELEKRRQLEGGNNRAPHFVTILSLDNELLSTEILERLLQVDEDAKISRSERGSVTYMNLARFKTRYAFVCPNPDNLDSFLDCLKVSDVLMILWPTDGEINDEQKTLLDIILSHGATNPMHLVAGLPQSGKQREQLKKAVTTAINRWISTKTGVFSFDSNSDVLQILRNLPNIYKKPGINQSRRPHMLVEKTEIVDDVNGIGTLKITGYVRGAPFNVNRLIHIQGWGSFQLSKITSVKDPRALREQKSKIDTDETVLATADPSKQESLQSEVIPDPMDAEQPDPLDDGDHLFKVPKIKKKIPKGMSEYQAEWIVDDEDQSQDQDEEYVEDAEYQNDDENMETDSDESDEENEESDAESVEENERIKMDMRPVDDEEMSVMSASIAPSAADNVSMAGIEDVINEDEVRKFREEVENLQWPDQIDVPIDQLACQRLQRYRGLKSFRTSHWDPKENLPLDYARIYKFAHFDRTKRLALAEVSADFSQENSSEVAMPGSYVTLYVQDVPSHMLEKWPLNKPLIAHGLLKNEQKFSLLNVVLRKYSECKTPIESKETLIFHIGHRSFEVEPLFSQHSNGKKFKLERFMPDRQPFVASFYAPVTYSPCPVLVFRQDQHGNKEFVAYGSVLDANPDRIVLKRIVLSGHPYKINKRSTIVRFMFFHKEDIEWFKPVEVYTDSGNRGHIKDSIGTHGLMKCAFNLPLKRQDQVKMNLYKRVYPKTFARLVLSEDSEPEPIIESLKKANADVEMNE